MQKDRPRRMPLLYLPLTMCAALMLISCVSSPSPEEVSRLAEKNRWELAHWGDRQVPHGDNGEPVILAFKDGRASGHADCNRYTAGVTFGPSAGEVRVPREWRRAWPASPGAWNSRLLSFGHLKRQRVIVLRVRACHSRATSPHRWNFIVAPWNDKTLSNPSCRY